MVIITQFTSDQTLIQFLKEKPKFKNTSGQNMHNDNIVNNVCLMSKVQEEKVTYTNAAPAVLLDVMSMG